MTVLEAVNVRPVPAAVMLRIANLILDCYWNIFTL